MFQVSKMLQSCSIMSQPQEAAQMKAGGAAANEVELPLGCSPKSMASSVNHMTCAPKKLQFWWCYSYNGVIEVI